MSVGSARSSNIVHEDENWRQRLRSEAQAAGQWNDNWGFLEHAKPPGAVYVDRSIPNHQLSRNIAEQGVLYPFLLKTYRDKSVSHRLTHHSSSSHLITADILLHFLSPFSQVSLWCCLLVCEWV